MTKGMTTVDRVLDLWAAGLSAPLIQAKVGHITISNINGIIARARESGDGRAVRRGKGHNLQSGSSQHIAAIKRGQQIRQRRVIASKYEPNSTAELRALVAASNVKVTRLPPGPHLGWTPSWF